MSRYDFKTNKFGHFLSEFHSHSKYKNSIFYLYFLFYLVLSSDSVKQRIWLNKYTTKMNSDSLMCCICHGKCFRVFRGQNLLQVTYKINIGSQSCGVWIVLLPGFPGKFFRYVWCLSVWLNKSNTKKIFDFRQRCFVKAFG